MIIDHQTNFVYLSDSLESSYPKFHQNLVLALKEHKVQYDYLVGTNDVWAQDYMPIQVSKDKFVQFTYKPDYLTTTKKWSKTITEVDSVCQNLGLVTTKSDIILDGGNVSKWNDQVLMTTKVFLENPNYSEAQLIETLKNLLELEKIVFVPIEHHDWLGHSDGMARYISSTKVLINEYQKEEPKTYVDFLACLQNAGLEWKCVPFNPYNNENPNDAAGLYLNYMEVQDYIFLPVFGFDTDKDAIDEMETVFSSKRVVPVQSSDIAMNTGIINCATWNILK